MHASCCKWCCTRCSRDRPGLHIVTCNDWPVPGSSVKSTCHIQNSRVQLQTSTQMKVCNSKKSHTAACSTRRMIAAATNYAWQGTQSKRQIPEDTSDSTVPSLTLSSATPAGVLGCLAAEAPDSSHRPMTPTSVTHPPPKAHTPIAPSRSALQAPGRP